MSGIIGKVVSNILQPLALKTLGVDDFNPGAPSVIECICLEIDSAGHFLLIDASGSNHLGISTKP